MAAVTEEAGDLISIGEFARRSGLSISALRFYGDAGVLTPAHTDPLSGYRYYAKSQLLTAQLIRHLRTAEVPIAQIQALLSDPAAAEAQLHDHRTRLQKRFERGEAALEAAHELLISKELCMALATVIGSDLAAAIRQVAPAAGPCGQDKRYPAAVLIELREDGLRLAATDGHRLSVRDLPTTSPERGRVVLSVADAKRLAGWAAGAPAVSLNVRDGLAAEANDQLIRMAGVLDDYPDYEAVLARCGNSTMVVKTQHLVGHLDRAKELIVLKLSRSGAAADDVAFPAKYDGDDLTIGFNPAYLADALEAGIGPDAIFQLGSDVDPVAIRSADEGTLTWMVMPIHLVETADRSF